MNTLLQTAKFGTPLAQSLRVLAAEFREARMTRAEEKAARLPAMLTVPMIVFILPTLFIVVLGPAILSMLDTFSGRARDKPMEVTQTVRPGLPEDPLTANVIVNYAPGKPVKTAEPPPPPSEAIVVPVQVSVRAGDLVTIDADARALRDGSQHRLVLVPVGTPDDAVDWLHDGMPIAPDRVRVSLPASAPGPNEVRLYYAPPSGSAPQIAARAAVAVTSAEEVRPSRRETPLRRADGACARRPGPRRAGRPKWSRKVVPSYSRRNRPRRCNSGTTRSTKSSNAPGKYGGRTL